MNHIKYLFIFYSSLISTSSINAQEVDSPKEIRREKAIEDVGHILHYALPASAGLTTLIIGDKKGGWQFVKSLSTNIALTYALKNVMNKPRPEGATDGHAFPSGHTSMAFQGASFIQRRYGWKYGIPSYLLAGFVGYSRIEGLNDRHDGWDVLAGIIVGVGSTYLFTTPYTQEHLELTFSGGDGSYLVGVNFKF